MKARYCHKSSYRYKSYKKKIDIGFNAIRFYCLTIAHGYPATEQSLAYVNWFVSLFADKIYSSLTMDPSC